MNRRNLFKSLLALPLISCVGQKPVYKHPDDYVLDGLFDFSGIDGPAKDGGLLAPRDTDDVYYDQWLDGKDEMHL